MSSLVYEAALSSKKSPWGGAKNESDPGRFNKWFAGFELNLPSRRSWAEFATLLEFGFNINGGLLDYLLHLKAVKYLIILLQAKCWADDWMNLRLISSSGLGWQEVFYFCIWEIVHHEDPKSHLSACLWVTCGSSSSSVSVDDNATGINNISRNLEMLGSKVLDCWAKFYPFWDYLGVLFAWRSLSWVACSLC